MVDETVDIKIRASGNAKALIGQVTKALDKLEKEAKQTNKAFSDAFAVLQGAFGAGIALRGIDALGRAINQAFTATLDFSKGVAEVNSILDENNKLTKETTDTFIDFASEFATTSAQQAKSFYQIISSGVTDTTKALKVLRVANKAAVAGLTTTETAIRAIAATVNTFEQQGISANEVSDILFSTVKQGITNFEGLANNIGKVAPLAQNAGVSLSDLAGILAFLTKTGLSTEEAATGIRSILAGIIKPASEATAFAKKLGIEFNVTALQSKGLAKFLDEVRTATAGSTDAVRKLFPNVRALGPVLSVVNGNFKDFSKILDETSKSAGATDKAFDVISESAAFKVDRFKSSIEALEVQAGDSFREITGILADFGTETADALRETTLSVTEIADAMLKVVLVADTLSRGVSLAFSTAELVVQSFLLAFTDVFLVATHIISSFVSFIPGVGKAFTKIIDNLEVFRSSAQDVFSDIQDDIKETIDGDSALGGVATKIIEVGNAAEKGLGRFGKAARDNAEANKESQEGIRNELDATKTKIGEVTAFRILSGQQIQDAETAKLQAQIEAEELNFQEQLISREELTIKKIELLEQLAQEEQRVALENAKRLKLTEEEFNLTTFKITTKALKAKRKLQIAQTKFEKDEDRKKQQNLKDSLNSIATLTSSSNKTLFRIGQAARLATAITDGIAAIQKAIAVGPPLSFALVPAVTAAQAVNVAKIASAKPPTLQGGIDSVPPGFNNDTFPALLSSGERVVPSQTNQDLTEFLRGQDNNAERLERIAGLLESQTQNVNINIGEDTVTTAVRRSLESGNTIEVES